MAYTDLRDFIQALEQAGELKRIPFEVDPHLEITEFADRAVKQGGPALLFEKPKGSQVPLLINAFASAKRMEQMLRCLEDSTFPTGKLKAFASERSAGKRFKFRGQEVEMEVLTDDAFKGVDVALFASETDISKKYVPMAAAAGAYAIDNSSAFRMDDAVPLVVPEVNGDQIKPSQKIYANPNCVAAIMVMALWPLHQAGKLKRVIASTYQSASGAGQIGRAHV